MINEEPPLGAIREQGEWPWRPKGARSMDLNKEGSREEGKRNLGAGSSKKFENGARSKRNYQGARGRIKKKAGIKER